METWLAKHCNGRTRPQYERVIGNFGKYAREHGINIETLKETWRTAKYAGEMEKEKLIDKIHDLVEAYTCELKSHNYASKYHAYCLSVIRSYLAKGCGLKDVEVELPKHIFVTYHNRDLTKQDIRKILENANIRDRVFFLMMVESGMRPQTLVQQTYGNIKQEYEAGRNPMKIDLPSLILKDNPQPRFTFIGEDGYRTLKEYLSNRGKLKDNDPLFLPNRPGSMVTEKVGMTVFSNSFSRLATKLGLATKGEKEMKRKPRPVRLYGLRKYFNNNMRTDRSYIEFWMGHVDISHFYISNDVEEHRKRYAEGYPALRIYESIYEAAEMLTKQNEEIRQLKEEVANLKDYTSYIETIAANIREGKAQLTQLTQLGPITGIELPTEEDYRKFKEFLASLPPKYQPDNLGKDKKKSEK